MISSELIKALQESDPEGTSEVIIDGNPIHFVHNYPGYYDGAYIKLLEGKEPRAIIAKVGRKVRLHTLSIDDIIFDDPTARIEFEGLNKQDEERWLKRISDLREDALKIEADIKAWKEGKIE